MKYPWALSANTTEAIETLTEVLSESASQLASALTHAAENLEIQDHQPETDNGWEEFDPRHDIEEVGGLQDEQRAELDQVIEMHIHGERFLHLGARVPSGILIAGPGGVGKTTLAHAFARQLDAKIVQIDLNGLKGAEYGVAMERLRGAFQYACSLDRCVLLFDEIDTVVMSRRIAGAGAQSTELHSAVIELMKQLKHHRKTGLIAVATASRLELIESSLIRYGYFERLLLLDLPTTEAQRRDILEKQVCSGNHLVEPGAIDYLAHHPLARGLAGVDLADILNRAAANAGTGNDTSIDRKHIDLAIPKVRQIVFRRTKNDSDGLFQRALCQAAEQSSDSIDLAEVGGLKKARKELSILVEYIKRPSPFLQAGCDMPVGLLLSGRPGVGKTHLARHLAAHSKIPFLHVDGSAFIEMYVGVGAARVRDLFRLARRQAPAIIFIDEIDALAGRRHNTDNAEYYHTAVQLLAEIDGFSHNPNRRVVVIGATSNKEALDPALLRPGRLHPTIHIDCPQKEELLAIFQVHLGQNHTVKKTQLTAFAAQHQGRTGAFVHQLVNRARVLTVLNKQKGKIGIKDLKEAAIQIAELEQETKH